jgi:arginine deiminase
VAATLFAEGAATQVIVAGMPKLRAAVHLDTIFTFADRDVVTIYPGIVDAMQTFTLHPGDNDVGVEVVEASKPFVEVAAAAAAGTA